MYQEVDTRAMPLGLDLTISMTIILILALVGTILLFVFVLNENKRNCYTGAKEIFYEFFHFEKLVAIEVYKVCYMLMVLILSIGSIIFIFAGGSVVPNFGFRLLIGLLYLFLGNLFLRISYETLLVLFLIFKKLNKKSTHESNSKEITKLGENISGVVFCQNCANQFDATNDICPFCGAAHNSNH